MARFIRKTDHCVTGSRHGRADGYDQRGWGGRPKDHHGLVEVRHILGLFPISASSALPPHDFGTAAASVRKASLGRDAFRLSPSRGDHLDDGLASWHFLPPLLSCARPTGEMSKL